MISFSPGGVRRMRWLGLISGLAGSIPRRDHCIAMTASQEAP
jgi:hypothetical protein